MPRSPSVVLRSFQIGPSTPRVRDGPGTAGGEKACPPEAGCGSFLPFLCFRLGAVREVGGGYQAISCTRRGATCTGLGSSAQISTRARILIFSLLGFFCFVFSLRDYQGVKNVGFLPKRGVGEAACGEEGGSTPELSWAGKLGEKGRDCDSSVLGLAHLRQQAT